MGVAALALRPEAGGGQRRHGPGEPFVARTGQVHGDQVTFGCRRGHHRLPSLPVVPDAVKEQERFPGTRPFVRDGEL